MFFDEECGMCGCIGFVVVELVFLVVDVVVECVVVFYWGD